MPDIEESLSLWVYALDRYARPGAESDCLRLQDDHGWDICELLWIAWLSERRLVPDRLAGPALEAVRTWQREMTLPLRARRRELKASAQAEPRLEALRQALKRAELLSERETLTRLEALPARPTSLAPATTPAEVALSACGSLQAVTAEAYPLLCRLFRRWTASGPDAEPRPTC